VDKDGPVLVLRDENGTLRAALSAAKDGPVLGLGDENGTPRAALVVGKDGPVLSLYDAGGQGRANLGAASTKMPDGNTITYPESSMLLFGADGKAIWSAP